MRTLCCMLFLSGLLASTLATAETKTTVLSSKHTRMQATLNQGDKLIINYNLHREPRRYLYYYEIQCTSPDNANIKLTYPWKGSEHTVTLPTFLHGYPAEDENVDYSGELHVSLAIEEQTGNVQCNLKEKYMDMPCSPRAC